MSWRAVGKHLSREQVSHELSLAEHSEQPLVFIDHRQCAESTPHELSRADAERHVPSRRARPLRHEILHQQLLGNLLLGEDRERDDRLGARRGDDRVDGLALLQ
jgi:hypothetical protein